MRRQAPVTTTWNSAHRWLPERREAMARPGADVVSDAVAAMRGVLAQSLG
jgi:hypothetical protein